MRPRQGRYKTLLIAIPIFALVVVLTLQAAGVCVKQARYWTDAQLIEVAVRYQSSVVYRNPEGRQWNAMQIEGTPEAVTSFLKNNPGCCSVGLQERFGRSVRVECARSKSKLREKSQRSALEPGALLHTMDCGIYMRRGTQTHQGLGLYKATRSDAECEV
jgi:hypothetical protein